MYSCQKSQLATILEDEATLAETEPTIDAIIVDGSAFAHSMQPRIAKTFEEYATLEKSNRTVQSISELISCSMYTKQTA